MTSRAKPVTEESSIYADFMVCQGSKRSRRLEKDYGKSSAQETFKKKVAELMNDIPLKVWMTSFNSIESFACYLASGPARLADYIIPSADMIVGDFINTTTIM